MQDKFSSARRLNEAMPVASSIEANAADGNSGKSFGEIWTVH